MSIEPERGADQGPSPAQFEALRCEVDDLKCTLAKVAQAQSVECILSNGFIALTDRLDGIIAPLRSLSPSRGKLDDATLLQAIAGALERPDFRDMNKTVRAVDPKFGHSGDAR